MDSFKLSIKLFAATDSAPHETMIRVFHRWIQDQALPGHVLIDVATYGHVANGPQVVLISNEANLALDRCQGRLGLLYSRKRPLPGNFADRLRAVLDQTLKAAAMLEADPALAGQLRFGRDEILIIINDRLLAPNTPATFAEVQPDIAAVAAQLFGGKSFEIEHIPNAQALFAARLKAVSSARGQREERP